MQKITPFLWFNGNVQEATEFYISIFKKATIIEKREIGSGKTMSATIKIEGQEFILFDGGPNFTFTPAISLFVNCETQEEVDDLWDRLSAGGTKSRCGWLQDKYGLSWQIIPTTLGNLLEDPDRAKAKRVMDAMLKMDKIDIKTLQQAYDQQ